MRKYIHFLFAGFILGVTSCEDFLEPRPIGSRLTEEELMKDPSFIEGLLMSAYGALPNDYNNLDLDLATDNAVTNQKGAAISNMATGSWTSSYNPISEWETAHEQIRHLNLFLEKYEQVDWAFTPVLTPAQNAEKNRYMLKRLKGEAHGMRAYYMSRLLQFHSGRTSDGTLLGFPIITASLEPADNWKLPRNTFAQCVQQIMTDLDTAIANLPPVYADIAGQSMYNAAIGARYKNRLNGNSAKAIKARVALLAASPAFSDQSGVTWADAALIAGNLLKDIGTVEANGKTFYIYNTTRPREIIWEQSVVKIRTAEVNNFPPSLYGRGRTNPTQSLVDAFPMANGYPITADVLLSGYDPTNPYTGRDPRLGEYILYNGSTFKAVQINTHVDDEDDGLNVLETSTRTGYYLKKLMSPGVSLTPGNLVSSDHTYVLLRLREVLLNYAEAANEAWGPDGDPQALGFTARQKIQELRTAAGIASPTYLNSISDPGDMRTLIRNERRIELCFEGFRFWDLRRWNDPAALNNPANGVSIKIDNAIPTYTYLDVESRIYQPYMLYGPIPFNETIKYNIQQNAGW
jgi:hypothetical protein